MVLLGLIMACFLAGGGAAAGGESALAEGRHGISAFGDPAYPADFTHFAYANPKAPKGGMLTLVPSSGYRTFDSLNPFILKGTPAAGLARGTGGPPGETDLYFDSLMTRAMDAPEALYGLVAESVTLGPGRRWATFRLRENARFHDGTPIRADDVVFTFNRLMAEGHPRYRLQFKDVADVVAMDDLTVKYTFRKGAHTRSLPLQVAVLPILSKDYYSDHDFAQSTLEPPLGSGPYRIAEVDSGRAIVFRRDPHYWGRDLPVNRGRFNFDEIRFEYYRDRSIELEAFKAGEYDFREEFTSKSWATEYTGPAIASGRIKRAVLPDGRPSGVQGYFINTRRAKFADPRVRQALDLAFDFEWTNKTIFYGLYERNDSMFENAPLEAEGVPEGRERTLLAEFRDQLPDKVFGPPYQPPRTDGSGNNRANMRRAQRLLTAAGWSIENGVLKKDGKTFTIEFLQYEPSFSRVTQPYIQNLEKLGIAARIRLIDPAQYQTRLDNYDFDMLTVRYIPSLTPGPELREAWGSEAAKVPGTYNLAGVRDPVVDALIEEVVGAQSRPDLVAAARALDRVLMWGHYMVPHWHSGKHFIAYWDKFARPDKPPDYARGVVDLWWIDPEKHGKLPAETGGGRQ